MVVARIAASGAGNDFGIAGGANPIEGWLRRSSIRRCLLGSALVVLLCAMLVAAARVTVALDSVAAPARVGFLDRSLGSAAAAVPVREPLPGLTVRISAAGYDVERNGSSLSLSAKGHGRSRWHWHAAGATRSTRFGAETVIVGGSQVEQYLTVDRRQYRRTWQWSISLGGLTPRRQADGSIAFVEKPGTLSSLSLPAPRILDRSGVDVTPAGLGWRLERAGKSWRLSLPLDDAKLPTPYVIDPAITFDAASSTGGAGVSSLSWSHTVANQSNRMLVVGVDAEYATSSSCQASSVTFGGTSMTKIGQAGAGTGATGTAYECVSLWYLSAPGTGTKTVSVTFPSTMTGATAGAVSLYNVKQGAPDASNSSFNNAGATSTTVTTAVSNSWVVDIFGSGQALGNLAAAAGQTARWTRDAGGAASNSAGSSTKVVGSAGPTTLTWTQTGINRSAQVVAAFSPACSGGSLSLSAPAAASFPTFTLNGTNQTATTALVFTADDETGSNSGWNITGTSTTFTNASSQMLPTTATSATGASAAAASGNCSLPTTSTTYPLTLPAGTTPPTAVKLYNAAANSGAGPTDVTLTFQLAVPANTYRGNYTSTWTFAIVSGP